MHCQNIDGGFNKINLKLKILLVFSINLVKVSKFNLRQT
jgi:hypothetical protein